MVKEAPGCGKQGLAGSFGGCLEDLKSEKNIDKGDWVDEVSEQKRAPLRIGLASINVPFWRRLFTFYLCPKI